MAVFGVLVVVIATTNTFTNGSGGQSAPVDISIIMSSYLGGGTEDTAVEALTVAMDTQGTVYVGGRGGFNFGLVPTMLDSGGDGFILVLTNSGMNYGHLYRFGTEVNRIVVRDTGHGKHILVQGDTGLILFTDDLDHMLWKKVFDVYTEMVCGRGQCYSDLGADGTVAVIMGPEDGVGPPTFTVQSFSANSLTLGSVTDRKLGDVLTDVAVDPRNKQIIIASYLDTIDRRIPCVIAMDYSATVEKWRSYCVDDSELVHSGNTASCWPVRLHYSDTDHRLHLAATATGANCVLRYDPLDIRNNHGSLQGLRGGALGRDAYTEPSGLHATQRVSFLATYTPDDGHMQAASFFLTRTPHTSPAGANDLRSCDVVSGPQGTVLVAQDASAVIENRARLTINQRQLAPYAGSAEAVLLGLSPGLDRREVWHHFASRAGGSRAVAVAASGHQGQTRVALLASSSVNTFVTSHELPGTGRAESAIQQRVLIVLDLPSRQQ